MRFFASLRPILTTPIRHVRLLEWSAELAALEKSVAAVAARRGGRLMLIAGGYWVFAGGLADTDAATVIDNRGEQAVFSDGPFVESKEYLAGVWVWEAPDLDVALKLAAEASKVCDRKIEVRPFQ